MRRILSSGFFIFSLFSFGALAQEGEVPLSGPVSPAVMSASSTPLTTEAASERSAENVPHFEEAGVFLGGFGGMNFGSYSLSSSSGFAAELPFTWGPVYGGSIGWRPNNLGWDYLLNYSQRSASYSGLTSLSPTSLEGTWREVSMEISGHIAQNVRLFVGTSYEVQSPSIATSPNAVLTELAILKLTSGIKYSRSIGRQFFFHSRLGVTVPVMLDETPQFTGAYRLGYEVSGMVQLGYRVSPFIDFSVGVGTTYSALKFASTGTRGLSNGSESKLNISLPAELKFYF